MLEQNPRRGGRVFWTRPPLLLMVLPCSGPCCRRFPSSPRGVGTKILAFLTKEQKRNECRKQLRSQREPPKRRTVSGPSGDDAGFGQYLREYAQRNALAIPPLPAEPGDGRAGRLGQPARRYLGCSAGNRGGRRD